MTTQVLRRSPSVGNAVGGTGSIVGTEVVFTPTLNYIGPASFDDTVSDGSLSNDGSVSFNVAAVNGAPVLTSPNAFTLNESNTSVADNTTAVTVTNVDETTMGVTFTVSAGVLDVL